MERFPKGMILSGTVLMGVTVALGWGGLGMIIRGEIAKQMRLINGTDTYAGWQNVPIPVYLSIYLFNLTNAADVLAGKKPIVKETGPYVYREKLFKDVDEDNVINETLRYRQIRTYFFEQSMSTGTEDDMITLINEPMLYLAKSMKEMKFDASLGSKAESWLKEKGEMAAMNRPVREWLFGGFSVQHYVDLVNDTMIMSAGDLKLHEQLEDGMFSAIDVLRKNNSEGRDGEWLIQTGRNVTEHFGKVVGWNGFDVLPFYKADTCNAVNGTDGSLYHPFVKETTSVYVFSSELCRSIPLTRGEMKQIHGVEAFRYFMDPMVMATQETNPDNWCFCTSEDSGKCNKNGLHYLETCLDGFPRSVSLPHFMAAEDDVKNGVDGLMPKTEGHETFYDIHPLSGIVLKSSKRLQFNLELMPYSNMPSFANVKPVSLPIFWMDETLDADHSDVSTLIFIKMIQETWANLRWGMLGLSGILVFIGVAIALTRRTSIKAERVTLIQ